MDALQTAFASLGFTDTTLATMRTLDLSDRDYQLLMLFGAGNAAASAASLAAAGSNYRLLSAAASTNGASVKAAAGTVLGFSGFNANAAARYLKIYDKASAPTVGTDTPIVTEYLAPQAKFTIAIQRKFTHGIAIAFTTGVADNDTGALTAADILAFNLAYR